MDSLMPLEVLLPTLSKMSRLWDNGLVAWPISIFGYGNVQMRAVFFRLQEDNGRIVDQRAERSHRLGHPLG